MHTLMLSLCPDFPYSLLEASATLIEDNELSLSIDYVVFLRAFQLRFLYDEFMSESQQIFRSSSHRLTCHVPTGESSIPQQDNNHRQILFECFQRLILTNTCLCPPLNILEDALLSTDQHHLNHHKFLIQLAKSEKLTRLIGKEPIILKQPRPIQQQRPIIEPITSIQNETKLILTSLSTPTTRISSPIASTILLPPLPKQQVLVRERPIRQGSASAIIVQTNLNKRPESAGSLVARSGSAKSATAITNIIQQEINETDSDVESRSSDTDT
jgi:hypothetical protein